MSSEKIYFVGPLTTAAETARIMNEATIGCLVVVDKGKPVGIVTERDLVRQMATGTINPAKCPVIQIMSRPLITIRKGATLREASRLMTQRGIRRLVVEDEHELLGVITARDLARYVKEPDQQVAVTGQL
jgi:CBS domain-containing protein